MTASALQVPDAERDHIDSFAADKHLKVLRSRHKPDTALCQAKKSDAVAASKQHGFTSDVAAPYVIHLGFLTATAVAVMNIQVVTRYGFFATDGVHAAWF